MKKIAQPRRRVTARSVLRDIDIVLARGTSTSSNLWAVLTALRGPDAGPECRKLETTMPLRTIAFPKTAHRYQAETSFGFGPAFARLGTPVCVPSVGTDHFTTHVAWAISALNTLGYLPRKV